MRRVDHLISEIRELHKPNMHGEKAVDVLLVSRQVSTPTLRSNL